MATSSTTFSPYNGVSVDTTDCSGSLSISNTSTMLAHNGTNASPIHAISGTGFKLGYEEYILKGGGDWASYGQHMYLIATKHWATAQLDIGDKVRLVYRRDSENMWYPLDKAVALQDAIDAVNS